MANPIHFCIGYFRGGPQVNEFFIRNIIENTQSLLLFYIFQSLQDSLTNDSIAHASF
jgi:hypothetical protein